MSQGDGNAVPLRFCITTLAQSWKNGTQNPQCGFVMISDSTTVHASTYSGEIATIDYRPYVVVNYTSIITLDQAEASLYKGNTMTLTATKI